MDNDPSFHPLFSDPGADIVLASKGGSTRFRVHSWTLKTTSGFFRQMFSLPNPDTSPAEVLYLDEDEVTLEHLLRMACGFPLLPVQDYDQIDALLFAAEKFDMPGPMSIIRLLVSTQPLAGTGHPLRLYSVACRYGWAEEAKLASTQTLTTDLHDPEFRPLLQRLSTTAVLDLFQLRHARREGLRKRLNDPPFVPGGSTTCISCHSPIDYHTWRELKYKIVLEMDLRPLGDTIMNYGLVEWREAQACWAAKCKCDRNLYDKAETLRVIRECIDGLPKSIEGW
ncbi:hypothetical protein FISHEDRAFT_39617 [Fistulina hepatica ATCC 64428]|uniref:BTB domain-containing protein n=1 Tax=Fistulina hepatica ATCC 64428 TaxID=1128425 RepID=A0A0D7AGX5_9AGAR|nr:hypothetical protein FISHEDRAFT_39617 [Fistulina hepatica ATCC 64428]